MQDLGERISFFASIVLKTLIVLAAARAIFYALGVGTAWEIPILDPFISLVASVLKSMSEAFFNVIDKHFSFK